MLELNDAVLEVVTGGSHLRTGNIKVNQKNFSAVEANRNKLDFEGGGGDMIIVTVTQSNYVKKPNTSI